MKTFIISGTFKMGENTKQPFEQEVVAESPKQAKEKIYCALGGRHACPRRFIKIKSIKEKV